MKPGDGIGGARPSALAGLRARVVESLRFHPREAAAIGVLAVLVTGGAALAYVRSRPLPAAAIAPVQPSASAEPASELVVHVVGAVARAGVYRFAEGARVEDAIRAAGGFTRVADRAAINLARLLVDGEQIVVPVRGAAPAGAQPAGSGGSAGGKVNINTAGVSEFDSLPGIGPVLAQRIVDYREQHGPFRSVRDLMKVPGIGPRKFESLESLVTV